MELPGAELSIVRLDRLPPQFLGLLAERVNGTRVLELGRARLCSGARAGAAPACRHAIMSRLSAVSRPHQTNELSRLGCETRLLWSMFTCGNGSVSWKRRRGLWIMLVTILPTKQDGCPGRSIGSRLRLFDVRCDVSHGQSTASSVRAVGLTAMQR